MALPKVSVKISSDGLGGFASTPDGIAGLVCSATAVSGGDNLALDKTYKLNKFADLTALGVTVANNKLLYNQVNDFYQSAGSDATLYIRGVAAATNMKDYVDKTKSHAVNLLNDSKGEVNLLGISKVAPSVAPSGGTLSGGIWKESSDAVVNAQALAEDRFSKNEPLQVFVDAVYWNGSASDLTNYSTASNYKVSLVLGANNADKNGAVGTILGQVAKNPVVRSIARVRNGALPVTDAYLTDGKTIDEHKADWDDIHDKKYISYIRHSGLTGIYYNSDYTLTKESNDLKSISLNRVIDKVTRITYTTFTDFLGDEVQVDASTGFLSLLTTTALVNSIESAINTQMKQAEPSEIVAVRAIVNPNQNIQTQGKIKIKLRVVPFGYNRQLEIDLGYATKI